MVLVSRLMRMPDARWPLPAAAHSQRARAIHSSQTEPEREPKLTQVRPWPVPGISSGK